MGAPALRWQGHEKDGRGRDDAANDDHTVGGESLRGGADDGDEKDDEPVVDRQEVADRRAGMVVDELTGQQEIVIKPFDAVKDGLSVFSGATILGDGVPALILDVSSLF